MSELAALAAGVSGADLAWVSWQAAAASVVHPPGERERDDADVRWWTEGLEAGLLTPGQILVVGNAGQDIRLARPRETAGATARRFGAAVPLVDEDGWTVGVLRVAAVQPRTGLDEASALALTTIARLLVHQRAQQDKDSQREALLEAGGQVSFRTDADGLIVELGPSWTSLTGHAVDACLGLPLAGFLAPADQERVTAVLRTASVFTQVVDVTVTHQAGGSVPVDLTTGPLAHSPATPGRGQVGLLTDLRDRRRREMQNGHDQKLEALGRLSAGIAHEINTPIQFVGDNTRFLADAYKDMVELLLVYRSCLGEGSGAIPWQERQALLDAAERTADVDYLAVEVPSAVAQSLEGIERVATLVQAMKAFSYKDAAERSYADLNDAIQTTLAVARNETKYVADVVLDLQELPPVLCHVGDLNQVFLNLLVNAADALRDQGEQAGRGEIRVSTAVDGAEVTITVADNAGGIPPEIQDKVFEPFFTTKDLGRGTGQGLPLARAVVHDKHGGTITLVSELGKGSAFVIRLPVAGPRPVG